MTPRYYTEIEVLDVVIRDPVTALTNILILAAALWSWKRVKDAPASHTRSWGIFFLMLGVSSLVGVVVHGFSYYMNERTHFWVWILMGTAQNVGISFAQLATAQHYFPREIRWIRLLILAQLIATTFCFIYFETYEAAKLHVAFGLLPVMGWNIYQFIKRNKPAGWIALGIIISALTAAVHSFKISLGPWFNFNDIAHLLIVTSILVMYRGVKRMC